MVPETMWKQTDTPIFRQLTSYNQYQTWNDVALLPHQYKCGKNYVNIPSLTCNCGSDPNKDRECLVQKSEFTASLLATRLFCSDLEYYGNKFSRDTFAKSEFNFLTYPEDRNPYMVEYSDMNTISILTMGWINKCRNLAFVTAKDNSIQVQFELLDYCLTIVQKCQDFKVSYPTMNADGTSSMTSECNMTEEEYAEIYGKFNLAKNLDYVKLGTSIGSGVVSIVCLVTTVATGGLAAPVTGPVALIVGAGAYGGGKVIEAHVNHLKDTGKTIEFGVDDAISIGGIGLNLIGLGLANDMIKLAPDVKHLYNAAKEAKTVHGFYKLHKNIEQTGKELNSFTLERISHEFSYYRSLMTYRLFTVMINTMNVLNNELGTKKYFLFDAQIAHKSIDGANGAPNGHAQTGNQQELMNELQAKVAERERIKREDEERRRNGFGKHPDGLIYFKKPKH